MAKQRSQPAEPSRRTFLKSSTAAAAALGLGGLNQSVHAKPAQTDAATPQTKPPTPEWRNRHSDMSYRMLGRTGFMVSEVVMGGFIMTPDKVDLYEAALDRGVNYLDQANSYGNGKGERAVGALLKRGVSRDRFFLTTKLSSYGRYVRDVYDERFKSLTDTQQTAVKALTQKLRDDAQPTRTGYHVRYFGGQEKPMALEYQAIAMKQLGHTAGTKKQFQDKLYELLEQSFQRTGADHYDVLFCPHSVESPEAFDDEALLETMAEFRQQGKARALAFSCHNDTGRILEVGSASGLYDVAMVAYNMVNHLMMDPIIEAATERGLGVIAMKAARPVIIQARDWRIAKLNLMIPGDKLNLAQKAYLFALQNPHLSAVISEIRDTKMIDDNLALAGRKVELRLV